MEIFVFVCIVLLVGVLSFISGMLLQHRRMVKSLIEAWIERSTLGINAFDDRWIEIEVKSFRKEDK